MVWIESHQTLLTHRKTGRLARALGVSKITAIGHLHAFWWWAMDNAPSGDLSSIEPADIADGACWEGDADSFLAAMTGSGFIDAEGGPTRIHDWMDYAGRLVQKREANAARMRAARAGHHTGTEGERATHVQRTTGARAGATVPNQTVPNRTEPNHERRPGADAPIAADAAAASDETTTSKRPEGTRPAPKPNKFADVIDALRAIEVEVTTTKADAGAVKDCSAPAALIAEAYGAAYRGDWPPGETWLRNNLNLQAVCKRIDGYRAFKEGTNGGAQTRTGRPGQPDRQRPGGRGDEGNAELAEYQRREEQRGLAALAEARRRRAGAVVDS